MPGLPWASAGRAKVVSAESIAHSVRTSSKDRFFIVSSRVLVSHEIKLGIL